MFHNECNATDKIFCIIRWEHLIINGTDIKVDKDRTESCELEQLTFDMTSD